MILQISTGHVVAEHGSASHDAADHTANGHDAADHNAVVIGAEGNAVDLNIKLIFLVPLLVFIIVLLVKHKL